MFQEKVETKLYEYYILKKKTIFFSSSNAENFMIIEYDATRQETF